ncbi:sulfurtransferase TusA family protein [uncultured Roseobacter sp.]|uniref:sulfurtransferase TusA family protein n=1 Tax=uncultured Roseobacter sp. TaxID=114847 RepID=UPI002637264F|nr:sulfurtransferase TusA family protein [uncultured Roseobacter sp.]
MTDKNTELDATGLLCPLPVLKARKRLQGLSAGETLTVRADDPAAIVDVPHFCHEAGHELVSATNQGKIQTYVIRKKAG